MSKVPGASCQPPGTSRPPGRKGVWGYPAQLTSMLGRRCKGRKSHFALGRVCVRVLQRWYFIIPFGGKMTKHVSRFRGYRPNASPSGDSRPFSQCFLQLRLS